MWPLGREEKTETADENNDAEEEPHIEVIPDIKGRREDIPITIEETIDGHTEITVRQDRYHFMDGTSEKVSYFHKNSRGNFDRFYRAIDVDYDENVSWRGGVAHLQRYTLTPFKTINWDNVKYKESVAAPRHERFWLGTHDSVVQKTLSECSVEDVGNAVFDNDEGLDHVYWVLRLWADFHDIEGYHISLENNSDGNLYVESITVDE